MAVFVITLSHECPLIVTRIPSGIARINNFVLSICGIISKPLRSAPSRQKVGLF